MRISTASAYDATITSLQKRQEDLSEAQARLTSGKRVLRPSDDPAAAARAERALATIARSDANQRALDASRNAMAQSESALGDAGDLLQQLREALVAAGNGTYSDTERAGVANKIAGLRAQLLAVANRGDGAGNFLFGGQGASQPPFIEQAGGVAYVGSSGQTQAPADQPMPLTVDGQATWLQARTGNGQFVTGVDTSVPNSGGAWIGPGSATQPSLITGSDTYRIVFSVSGGSTTYSVLKNGAATALSNVAYTSGQAIQLDGQSWTVTGTPANGDAFVSQPSTPSLNIFDRLDQIAKDLNTPGRTASQIAQTVSSGLRDLDQASARASTVRSQLGDLLNLADNAELRNNDLKLHGQTARSAAEDLDMTQAISDFQNQQTGYDAALKTYSMVQKMSLFQYISGN